MDHLWIIKELDILKIECIPAGVYAANCYIVYSEQTKKGFIVDPGGSVDKISMFLEENQIEPLYILLTHAHGDHIMGVPELARFYPVKVGLHKGDLEMLADASINLSSQMTGPTVGIEPDFTFEDGDLFTVGDLKVEVIHTPGHSLGGSCFAVENVILTGDTLFAGSIGRTDLTGGDYDTLIASITNKLLTRSDDLVVLPGHGPASSISKERYGNPFLRGRWT
jgi:glyoxylase-like metal-dependent hydrolase (beta-lactamase superfamily II)